MPLKRYICTVHPNLRIGAKIKFSGGYFETDNQFLQSRIEKNDCWGWAIKEVTPPEEEKAPAPSNPEMEAAVNAVARTPIESADDDGLDLSDDEPEEKTTHEEMQVEARAKSIDRLTATDINVMKKDDLLCLVDEIEAEIPKDRKPSVAVLKRAVRQKLGV